MALVKRILSVIEGKGNSSQYGRDGGEAFGMARAGVCPVARCSGVLGKVSTYLKDQKEACKRFLQKLANFFNLKNRTTCYIDRMEKY